MVFAETHYWPPCVQLQLPPATSLLIVPLPCKRLSHVVYTANNVFSNARLLFCIVSALLQAPGECFPRLPGASLLKVPLSCKHLSGVFADNVFQIMNFDACR
jgi:hypothetical protein